MLRCVLPCCCLPCLLSQIDTSRLPKKQHAGQHWVAICANWLEMTAVGGAAGTPPGLRPCFSGSVSEGGLVSQVRQLRG